MFYGYNKEQPGRRTCSTDKNKIKCMTAHWEEKGGPSAPRVEHRYYAGDGMNGKNWVGGGWKVWFSFFFSLAALII